MQKKTFVSKVFRMSSVMLFLNISTIVYSIFVSKRAGPSGIGIFHLIMSVYSLAVTLSVSGIGLTATRLIADMPLSLSRRCADSVVTKCIKLICIPAVIATSILFFCSDFIAKEFVKIPECSGSFKYLSVTLLFTAFSSVINGYFTAFGRVGSISFGKAMSETTIWLSTVFLLKYFPHHKTYMAVVIALCIGTITESLCCIYLWRRSVNHLYCQNGTDYSSIVRLCAPIAVGSYLRMGLTGAENILIPSMLRIFGSKNPVGDYGIIKGMTLPILMFPAVFTGAFTSLIVPEIASRRARNLKNGIKYISSLSVEYILKFAFPVSVIFFKWHNFLGETFFGQRDAGKYLGCFFVFPLFYFLDSVVDSVLKGMDEQVASLKINIIDSICRVFCTIVFIPKLGMTAYIGIMYLSEFINLYFSYRKLKKVSGLMFPFKCGVIVPLFSVLISLLVITNINFGYAWADMCIFVSLYIALMNFAKKIFREE